MSSMFLPFLSLIVSFSIIVLFSASQAPDYYNHKAVSTQTTENSCNDVLATVSLFSNQTSISQVLGGPLLLQYSNGNLNATNLNGTCTFPRCVFPAKRTDAFIVTNLFTNQTVVLDHGAILNIGPEVIVYPNGTRFLIFPPAFGGGNRTEHCQLQSSRTCFSPVGAPHCYHCNGGQGGGPKILTETTLFADGTQRFDLGCGQPVVTVFPNGTKTYAYENGKFTSVQLPQHPPCPIGPDSKTNCPEALTYATQTLYQNGTQLLSIMGDPTVTVCSNGLETIGSVKQQRCGCNP